MPDQESNSVLDLDKTINQNKDEKSQQLTSVLSIGAVVIVIIFVAVIAYQFINVSGQSGGSDDSIEQPAEINNAYSQTELDEAREAFKKALGDFEANIQPFLDDPELQAYSQQSLAQINQLKQQAITSFAKSAYVIGLDQLNAAKTQAIEFKAAWDQDFDLALQQAQLSFDSDDMIDATLSLNQALVLKPSNPDAANLMQRIDAFKRVSNAIKALAIAKKENSLDRQIKALESIVQLDPLRTEFVEQLQKLKQTQSRSTVAQKINQAQNAFSSDNIALTQRLYAELNRMAPNNDAVKQLGAALSQRVKSIERTSTVNNLTSLSSQDDWQSVLQQGQSALSTYPNDAEVRALVQKAKQILGVQQQLQRYIDNPTRLQDGNIQAKAKAVLTQALPVLTQSNTLSGQVKQLNQLVSELTTKHPVEVTSDNKTLIKVLGVGVVGEVNSKVIELQVGTYTFEGQRSGYKNKQVRVTVTANHDENKVSLVCDERI